MLRSVGLYLTIGILAAQGWENLRDSLLVENERIETIDLEQRPLPQAPQLERPAWSIELPLWESAPKMSYYLPPAVLPGRPVWMKRAPLHFTYGLGRFWTQSVGLSWGRTRDLNADEGLSFTHQSTPVGHVSHARWGRTHLSGWVGRYSERGGWEATYRGGYEKFMYYAPYAERWEGFAPEGTLPDSLRGHYFRQELYLRAFDKDRGEVSFQSRRLDLRSGAPEWQAILRGELRPFSLSGWRAQVAADGFVEGRRFSLGISTTAEKTISSWQVRVGLRTVGGRDTAFRFVVSPLLRIIYVGLSPTVHPFIETQGDLTPMTYFSASELNPYLRRTSQTLLFTREWISGQLGVRGQGIGWDYRLAAEYRFIQGALSFVPAGAGFHLYGINSFQSLGAVLQAAYVPQVEGAFAEMRGVYRYWKASEPYYSLAPWEVYLRGGYRKEDRFSLSLSMYGIGSRTLASGIEAPPFVDISWEVRVRILPFLSIFAEMNNLLNRRFYRWYGYVERPLDFRLGAWLKFG
ncbi:MAG: hypothetical protein N2253_06945 [Bacteroidia bacterium]|nr:hypothetical protein [Bacteroidia bacterium]